MAQSAQIIDENGYLLVKGCPVSSSGVFDYSAAQVGETEGDPNRIVKVFRPEKSITDPELLKTLRSQPLIDDHTYLNGDPDASEEDGMAPEDVGIEGIMTDNVYYADGWLRADIKVFTRRLRKAIQKGKTDLSLGYSCRFIYEPGTYNGEDYEYVQIDMRANHIALVDEARVAGARVLDGLVFDSMRLDVIPSKSNKSTTTESPMDEDQIVETGDNADIAELLKQIQAKLEALTSGEKKDDEDKDDESKSGLEETEENIGLDPDVEDDKDETEAHTAEKMDIPGMVDMLEKQIEALREKYGAKTGDEKEDEKEKTEDSVQGLASEKGDTHVDAETQGEKVEKVSKGPGKGEHSQAGDSAIRRVYADIAAKDAIHKRVSPIIGTFDHSKMTASETAAYAVKKLGLKAPKGAEMIALDNYFIGTALAKSTTKAPSSTTKAADSSFAKGSVFAAYDFNKE